jgi:hypothetical protein
VFYSKDWAKSACQLGTFLGADEQGQCSFKHIFTKIYFEFQMPINSKVVCLEKMHNFGIWRLGSVSGKFCGMWQSSHWLQGSRGVLGFMG